VSCSTLELFSPPLISVYAVPNPSQRRAWRCSEGCSRTPRARSTSRVDAANSLVDSGQPLRHSSFRQPDTTEREKAVLDSSSLNRVTWRSDGPAVARSRTSELSQLTGALAEYCDVRSAQRLDRGQVREVAGYAITGALLAEAARRAAARLAAIRFLAVRDDPRAVDPAKLAQRPPVACEDARR
jgi:hypothetical protein